MKIIRFNLCTGFLYANILYWAHLVTDQPSLMLIVLIPNIVEMFINPFQLTY